MPLMFPTSVTGLQRRYLAKRVFREAVSAKESALVFDGKPYFSLRDMLGDRRAIRLATGGPQEREKSGREREKEHN